MTEVQVLTVWFRESLCGEHFGGKPLVRDDACGLFVPLLRELDWAAVRKVIGW